MDFRAFRASAFCWARTLSCTWPRITSWPNLVTRVPRQVAWIIGSSCQLIACVRGTSTAPCKFPSLGKAWRGEPRAGSRDLTIYKAWPSGAEAELTICSAKGQPVPRTTLLSSKMPTGPVAISRRPASHRRCGVFVALRGGSNCGAVPRATRLRHPERRAQDAVPWHDREELRIPSACA